MSMRYWKPSKEAREWEEEQLKKIEHLNNSKDFMEYEEKEQQIFRESNRKFKTTAMCSHNDKPCINPSGYCSVCPIDQGDA